MSAVVGILHPGGPVDPAVVASLEAASKASGIPGATSRRGDAAWIGEEGAVRAVAGTLRVAASPHGPALFFAPTADGTYFASSARALLRTGRVGARLDRPGVAGILWRGAPVEARLPLRGVRAVPRGGALAADARGVRVLAAEPRGTGAAASIEEALLSDGERTGEPVVPTSGGPASLALLAVRRAAGLPATGLVVRWPGTSPEGMHEAARAARATGARVEVVDLTGIDPAAALTALLDDLDLPDVDAWPSSLIGRAVARLGAARAVRASGGAALFLAGPAFAGLSSRGRGILRRAPRRREVADAFDAEAQADLEERAYARTPVPRLYARLALLGVAARERLLLHPERPPDGPEVAEAVGVREAASAAGLAVARSRALAGGFAPIETRRPWLDPAVIAAVRALPAAVRFGRPGSSGWLARRLREALAWRARTRAAPFEPALDVWLRGPLSAWLLERLDADRLAAQGVLEPRAVAEAVARWRAREGGLGARPVLALALLSHWLDREGLSDDGS